MDFRRESKTKYRNIGAYPHTGGGGASYKLANLRVFFLTSLQKYKIIHIEQLMMNEIVGCPVSSLMVYCYFAKGRIKGEGS